MKLYVYHNTESDFRATRASVSLKDLNDEFQLVATAKVDGDEITDEALEHVYALTNSATTYWGNNKQVTATPGKHRSTSVGDIIVVEYPNGLEHFYQVAGAGFNRIAFFS